jgi:hypothetical protein
VVSAVALRLGRNTRKSEKQQSGKEEQMARQRFKDNGDLRLVNDRD